MYYVIIIIIQINDNQRWYNNGILYIIISKTI